MLQYLKQLNNTTKMIPWWAKSCDYPMALRKIEGLKFHTLYINTALYKKSMTNTRRQVMIVTADHSLLKSNTHLKSRIRFFYQGFFQTNKLPCRSRAFLFGTFKIPRWQASVSHAEAHFRYDTGECQSGNEFHPWWCHFGWKQCVIQAGYKAETAANGLSTV